MTHWMTEIDDDGDPIGTVCNCNIDADHWPSGALMFPEIEYGEVAE